MPLMSSEPIARSNGVGAPMADKILMASLYAEAWRIRHFRGVHASESGSVALVERLIKKEQSTFGRVIEALRQTSTIK